MFRFVFLDRFDAKAIASLFPLTSAYEYMNAMCLREERMDRVTVAILAQGKQKAWAEIASGFLAPECILCVMHVISVLMIPSLQLRLTTMDPASLGAPFSGSVVAYITSSTARRFRDARLWHMHMFPRVVPTS